MKKIILQLTIVIGIFFGLWFVLSRVNWMKLFRIEKITQTTEEKLGDLFWEMYKDKEIRDTVVTKPVDSILSRLCESNHIDKSSIKLHVVDIDEVNAFALPNDHIIINKGLISDTQDEAELAGVMAHELAHLKEKHVMKKLVKEFGLSVLISITTGGGGGEVAEIARMLSSTAYDRKLEKEADMRSVDYMVNSKLPPDHLADFLYRLGQDSPDDLRYLTWISTHPDSRERGEYIVQYSRGKTKELDPVLYESTWLQLKNAVKVTAE